MKTINVDETVLDITPEVFKKLSADDIFKLTKTVNTREGFFFVDSGDSSVGPASIVNVVGKPGLKVLNTHGNNRYGFDGFVYIRTSPIVEVIDVTETVVTFRTEGGIYKLENVTDVAEYKNES